MIENVYQKLVRKLIYLSHIRSNITFSTSVVSQYMDAEWTSFNSNRKSTRGFRGNLVIWRSKKQAVVASSGVEVEFKAVVYGKCELLCLKNLLKELKIQTEAPMRPFCYSKVVIHIVHDLVQHNKTN